MTPRPDQSRCPCGLPAVSRTDDYFKGLSDAEFDRMVRYKSLDAGWFQSRLADILTQLFGHSWYHRGQIASLVKAAGGQSAITDYIYWSREAIDAPE